MMRGMTGVVFLVLVFPVLVFLVLAACVPAPPAFAHSLLLRASPAVGGTITRAPTELRLEFSETLDLDHFEVQVIDPSGRQLLLGAPVPVQSGPENRGRPLNSIVRIALLSDPAEPSPALPGTWQIRWRLVSLDGHESEGSFRFTLAAKPGH